jgi:hypothetical protein
MIDLKMSTSSSMNRYYYGKANAGGLFGPKKLIASKTKGLKVSKQKAQKFFSDDPVTRQFYGVPREKPRHVRNGFSTHILNRVHVDLMDMVNEQSSVRYGMLCIDNFSRFMWCIPVPTKQSGDMIKAFTQLLQQLKKYQTRPYMKNIVFMSDLGKCVYL